MPRVLVLHREYGCDSGCCGHVIEIDGERYGAFQFVHPYGRDTREFIRALVTEVAGPEHVADIDFENCIVME